jgi:autophagy-related protein 11
LGVQPGALLTSVQTELYLYDRELFTSSSARSSFPPDHIPDIWTPEAFPDELSDSNSLKAWRNLFIQRREWATELLNTCRSMCTTADEYISKCIIVERGLRVATLSHETHLANLRGKHKEAEKWVDEVTGDANLAWEEDYSKLSAVPANPAFSKFFGISEATHKGTGAGPRGNATLASFVDFSATETSAAESRTTIERLEVELDGFNTAIQKIAAQYEDLLRDLPSSQSRSLRDDPEEPGKQLQEVQAIANKVASDCEHVLGLKNDPKSLAQISKIALLHTRNFLPNLRDCAKEVDDLVRHCIEQKNAVVDQAFNTLSNVATIESSLTSLGREITSLHFSDEEVSAFTRVSLLGRIPLVYGSLLLEATRRREWVEKMKRDSATLAEELAGYQEEEQKRRKRWLKGVNDVLVDTIDGKVLGFEINLQGEDHTWPEVSRQELDSYVKSLRVTAGMEGPFDQLTQLIRDADRPTKQQIKRAKAFKMGSLHEAGLGKGSLMLRGDDEMRVMKEVNVKLEEETKGYKSRIRKLEDLLHRQSHVNRLSTVNGSQNSHFPEPSTPTEPSQPGASPRLQGDFSRTGPLTSRRFSSNQPQEDKAMARRLLQLENELNTEKEARAALEKESLARKETDKAVQRQVEDANSTKKDLMENMEAQQREFADERRSLEEELNKYKLKAEEMEDELENILGSRDNERTGTDAKLQALVSELEHVRSNAAEEVRQAQERAKDLEDALRHREELDVERTISLKGIYASLSPDQPAPEDPGKLVSELEDVAQRSADHAREIAQAVALAKSENENLQSLLDGHKDVAADLTAKLDAQEVEVRNAQEELASEKEKASSIAAELDEERGHLKDLRAKFADGETGSEALRSRIEEEEAKVTSISAKLAEAHSHVNILDVELSSLQSKYRHLQDMYDANASRLEQRSERAKIVTQRLYAQNDRINRLLEALGFLVTYEDDSMVVQRASKAAGSSTVLIDGGASLMRSTASPSPTKRLLDDLSDLSPLLWMEKDLPEDETAKFKEFMDKIERFNLDIFSEAVAKRMRDIEHTARKWQKEARAYRDKSHRAQSDAHDKIAFRSFKEGDLALFLPTRNQATRSWAAFNVGAPHYFLREQDNHKLGNKEWLIARINKVEERIVDLSKTMEAARAAASDGHSIAESEGAQSFEDDNPFDLSDGLRWYLLDAQEEKTGAPSTPGLGKATVSAANVDVRGSIRVSSKKKPSDAVDEASRALSRSLDSRRSSTGSKKSGQIPVGQGVGKVGSNEALRTTETSSGGPGPSHLRTTSDASSMIPTATDTGAAAQIQAKMQEEVRKDLLFGP